MRKFVIGLLSFFFSLVASIAILLVILKPIFSTPNALKTDLLASGIYESPIAFLDQQIKNTPESKNLLSPIAKEATPKYFQTKTEKYLDDLYAYADGSTNQLPKTSLSDLKKKLAAKNSLFTRLPPELDDIFEQEIGLNEEIGQKLRAGLQIYHKAYFVSLAVSALLLLLIFGTSAGWKTKLNNISRNLNIIALPGLIGTLIAMLLLWRVTVPIPQLPEPFTFLAEPITKFSESLTWRLLIVSLYVFGPLSVAGLGLKLMSRKIKPPAAAP